MFKVILTGVFALVMVNQGLQLIKAPDKWLAGLLKHTDESKNDEEELSVVRELASSKSLSNVLRAGGWMMIGCAFFILYESLF